MDLEPVADGSSDVGGGGGNGRDTGGGGGANPTAVCDEAAAAAAVSWFNRDTGTWLGETPGGRMLLF